MVSEKFIRNQISIFSHKPQLPDRTSFLKSLSFSRQAELITLAKYIQAFTGYIDVGDGCRRRNVLVTI